MRHIRPHCDPVGDSLFVGVKGKPISQLNQSTQWLGEKYKVVTPTCTQLRKVGATEAGLRCSESTRHLITSQMAHSAVVHTKHYEKIRGSREAAKAHAERERLAATADKGSESVSEDDNAGPEPSKQQKVAKIPYSEQEVAFIEAYFSDHIEKGRPAKPNEARAFLKLHSMERSFKQIQDKVRHIISQR